VARTRNRKGRAAAPETGAYLASGGTHGSYFRTEEPPLVRNKEDIVRNLEDVTEWAARELRRLQDDVLVGLEDSICLSVYDSIPARGQESNIHGGINQLVTAGAASSGTVLTFNHGIGKMFFVVNTAAGATGELRVSGLTVNRDTGSEGMGTSVIDIDGVSTDNSSLDANDNTVHSFTKAYITDKWFHGTISVSTQASLDIQDLDVYHCSFEQFNDNRHLWLTTFDVNLLALHANGNFDAYLYTVIPTGSQLDITAAASLNLGVPIADRYYRLRRGDMDVELDGSKDGVFVDVHYTNSPVYIEDVSLKVWASREL